MAEGYRAVIRHHMSISVALLIQKVHSYSNTALSNTSAGVLRTLSKLAYILACSAK